MMNLTHPDLQPLAEMYGLGWDPKSKKEATLFQKILTDLSLLLALSLYNTDYILQF